MALIVLKFGGTSVATIPAIENVANKVSGEIKLGHKVAVVVSAMKLARCSDPKIFRKTRPMVPTLDTRQLVPYLEQLMQSREHSLRERLMSFARDHNVNITQAV